MGNIMTVITFVNNIFKAGKALWAGIKKMMFDVIQKKQDAADANVANQENAIQADKDKPIADQSNEAIIDAAQAEEGVSGGAPAFPIPVAPVETPAEPVKTGIQNQ